MTALTTSDRALHGVQSVVRALNLSTKALERRLGISEAQLVVLEHLRERATPSLAELAARTATDESTTSVVVKRLVDRQLATRQPAAGDRRKVHIALTDDGRKVLADAPPSIATRLRRGFSSFTESDGTTLVKLFDRWLAEAGIRRQTTG